MFSRPFWRPRFAAARRPRAMVGALAISLLPALIFAAWPAPASNSVFDFARLEALLQRNPATGRPVDLVAELVPLLPRELRSNFTFVYDSRSPFRLSISPEFPRVLLFTGDARLVLTFTGDPGKPVSTSWKPSRSMTAPGRSRCAPTCFRRRSAGPGGPYPKTPIAPAAMAPTQGRSSTPIRSGRAFTARCWTLFRATGSASLNLRTIGRS